MENKEYDILNSSPELKKSPYSVPEGYFDDLKKAIVKNTEPQVAKVSLWVRLTPYLAVAGMFIFILLLGNIFLTEKEIAQEPETEEALSYEDFLVFSSGMTDIALYNIENEAESYESELLDDEIIDYLIYTGVSGEYIEYYK